MGSDTPFEEPFYGKNEEENEQILGYVLFYLKKGKPVRTNEGEIMEIPLTLEKKIVAPELKESFEKYFDGRKGIPTEEEVTEWLKQTEIEKCISCGAETPYTITTHIDQRKHYIEGAGQLCVKCYNETYNKK